MTLLRDTIVESLFALTGPAGTVDDVLSWIAQRNRDVVVRVNMIPFHDMRHWAFDQATGNLHHESGKFFSIEGVHVVMDTGQRREWSQPIINQPEIGFLGILAKEINGVLCFLLQAKVEPGNVNQVQLSPTLQATRSNYSQIHRGIKPRYLEYFQKATRSQTLLDQLQSEQGARFLRKRNRNIVLTVEENIPLTDDFQWLTLGQIKALMRYDNVVNMDTRTVLSGLPFHTCLKHLAAYDLNGFFDAHAVSQVGRGMFLSELSLTGANTIDYVLHWLSELKTRFELLVDRIPLAAVTDWHVGEYEIARSDRQYFRVVATEVHIGNREVHSWCQPLVEPMQEGLCAMIVKRINGVYHALVQAKVECGNFDVAEMAPTVQCLTGRYSDAGVSPPPFVEYVLECPAKRILFDTRQSEEGGRFYHEANRNMIVEADDSFPDVVPPNFIWLTLGQMKDFLRFNNYLNIQVRSLIAVLDYR